MGNPASDIALLIVGILIFIALVCWWFKSKINNFVRSLLTHREQQAARRARAETASVTV